MRPALSLWLLRVQRADQRGFSFHPYSPPIIQLAQIEHVTGQRRPIEMVVKNDGNQLIADTPLA
jgi:hypothetical protein